MLMCFKTFLGANYAVVLNERGEMVGSPFQVRNAATSSLLPTGSIAAPPQANDA